MTRREIHLAIGFCATTKCKNKAREGKRTCQDCCDSARAERERAKANGICIVCLKRDISPKSVSVCDRCLDSNKKRVADYRVTLIADGVCRDCRKRQARPDAVLCEECTGLNQVRQAAYSILDLQDRMETLAKEAPEAAAEARAQFEGLFESDPGVLSVLETYEGRWRERRN
jgi:hypothetical protein